MVEKQIIKDDFAVYLGDCIEAMKDMPDNIIDMSIYSPPFAGLYQYSSDPRDISNNESYSDFLTHYEYVVKEKARITKPGRMSCVHVCDVPSGNSGNDHLIDLPGDVIRMHEKQGFKYVTRYTIWKEPLGVRNRTYAKSLFHKTIVVDSTKSSNAGPDYVLVFRNSGTNENPVTHENGILEYAGETPIPHELLNKKGFNGNQIENNYSHWIWRQYASSVWMDIRIGRVLPFQNSRDPEDEKHVHPLQLDVIDRCVELYSNPNEVVFTPFMGVGSEVFGAVSKGRRAIGVELKSSYFRQAVMNLKTLKESNNKQETLFGV